MGRWSNAGIHASAKYVRRRSDGAPGANVAKWLPHGRYLCSAIFLATSTAVRLPQQKSMLHNPSALFCVSMTLFAGGATCARRPHTHAHAARDRKTPLACCIVGQAQAVFRTSCGESTSVGLQQFHSAGPVGGNVAGGGVLCVHLQPEAAGVPATVDGGVDAFCLALLGRGAGAVGARYATADRTGSLAVRGGGAVLSLGRATLLTAQAVEACGRRRRGSARRLGGGQRAASF